MIGTISRLNGIGSSSSSSSDKEKKKPSIKIADESINDDLTGFKHNAVSPLGLRTPEKIKILISQACMGATGGYIYLGAGCQHAKLGISVDDLVGVTGAEIGDYSETRVDFDSNLD